jgi:hypothetical protein
MGDTWILTAGEGRQHGGGVDWAATVSTDGLCSLMMTTNKRRGDERGKGMARWSAEEVWVPFIGP